MQRVTGIGGIFFQAEDPEKLYQWYEKHLGMRRDATAGGVLLQWRENDAPEKEGLTVWALFGKSSKQFEPSRAPFMLNYRVENLDGLLEALRAEGVTVDKREDYDYGSFAWIMDPEGNKIELWEPK